MLKREMADILRYSIPNGMANVQACYMRLSSGFFFFASSSSFSIMITLLSLLSFSKRLIFLSASIRLLRCRNKKTLCSQKKPNKLHHLL